VRKFLATILFAAFVVMIPSVAHAQNTPSEAPVFQIQHHYDWLQPTTGPERTFLFMGYHVTFLEVGRFNFGGIGLGMGVKRMSPNYPYTPEPWQVEIHPLITTHLGYRFIESENFWINVSFTYDPIRKSRMIGFGLSANPINPTR